MLLQRAGSGSSPWHLGNGGHHVAGQFRRQGPKVWHEPGHEIWILTTTRVVGVLLMIRTTRTFRSMTLDNGYLICTSFKLYIFIDIILHQLIGSLSRFFSSIFGTFSRWCQNVVHQPASSAPEMPGLLQENEV